MDILTMNLNTKETFGIPSENVLEIITKRQITKMFGYPKGFEGVFDFRGTIVPVLSMSSITDIEDGTPELIIVLEEERNTPPFAILVKSVTDVIIIDDNKKTELSTLFGVNADHVIEFVAQTNEGELISNKRLAKVL